MSCSHLEPYHYAWLEVHPNRSEGWLRDRLSDGFDVHHLDGDHNNNEADNLMLIEHSDHMSLHGGRTLGRLKRLGNGDQPRKRALLSIQSADDCAVVAVERAAGSSIREIACRYNLSQNRVKIMIERHSADRAWKIAHGAEKMPGDYAPVFKSSDFGPISNLGWGRKSR